jgi:hypothetical protein
MVGSIGLRRVLRFALAVGMCLSGTAIAVAQNPAAGPARQSSPPAGFRKLGPGVLTVVPPPVDPHDTVENHNLVELLAPGVVSNLDWTPKFSPPTKTLRALATDRAFRRSTWYLQFSFKPLRLIEVDLPVEHGRLQRKVVWYLVYRVKNIGGQLKPVEQAAAADAPPPGAPEVQTVNDLGQPIYFFPRFSLEADIEGTKKVYLDQLIPQALDPIRRREDPNRKLLDSVEISSHPIPLSTAADDQGVWGVATWVDIDPRIDYFSIYVNGLTNAYRWTDPPGAFKAGDPPGSGRQYTSKTLQLNFWRPGDEFRLLEDEIFMGAPADKVARTVHPDHPDQPLSNDPVVGSGPGGRNWDKIIDYRWLFR